MSASAVRDPDQWSDRSHEGRAPKGYWFIYFYGTEDGGEVKIGKTRQRIGVRRQQHQNQAGHEVPMRTLAVVLGQNADEIALKEYFKPFRSRSRSKEWFAAGEKMRAYLRWLRGQSFVAPGELEMDTLTAVDSSAWLPDASRFRQATQLHISEADPWSDLVLDHVTEGDFYTHQVIIEAARTAMGSIDLDPASCREANTVVRATRFFGFRENGLLQEWAANVWLNPPYGNWQEWTPKAVSEWGSGRISQMCLICTTRVMTAQSFHPIVKTADALVVMCGRYPFWGPKATSSPDEGHTVFYFGSRVGEFRDAFSLLGTTFTKAAA